MKKKLIAASAASLAVAAMPVVGVFAVTNESFIDNLTITVPKSCTFVSSADGTDGAYTRSFVANIAAGHVLSNIGQRTDADDSYPTGTATGAKDSAQPTMTIACTVTEESSTSHWTLSAVGGTVASPESSLIGQASVSPANTIPTGTNTAGSTSSWAFKIAVTGGTALSGGSGSSAYDYAEFSEVPGSSTSIATGGPNSTTAATITPTYQVYVSPTQAADTYKGSVTYVLAYPSA